jgi:hypothetical protein
MGLVSWIVECALLNELLRSDDVEVSRSKKYVLETYR